MSEFYYPRTYSVEESEYAQQKIANLYAKDQPTTDEALDELATIYEEYIYLKRLGIDPDMPQTSLVKSEEETKREQYHRQKVYCNYANNQAKSSRRTMLSGIATLIVGPAIGITGFTNVQRIYSDVDGEVDQSLPPSTKEDITFAQQKIEEFEGKISRETIDQELINKSQNDKDTLIRSYAQRTYDRQRLDLRKKLLDEHAFGTAASIISAAGGSTGGLFGLMATIFGTESFLRWRKTRINLMKSLNEKN